MYSLEYAAHATHGIICFMDMYCTVFHYYVSMTPYSISNSSGRCEFSPAGPSWFWLSSIRFGPSGESFTILTDASQPD